VEREQDSIYIKRVLEGERNAFAFLVDRYKSMVFTLALQFTRDREEAEEIAQESFIKAYQSLGRFQGKARFSSWLYRIVYNTAISHLRARVQGRVSLEDTRISETKHSDVWDHHEALSNDERKKCLEMALESLDPGERFLVVLYHYEEKELEEIARIAGITKTNAKVRLYRARKKMLAVLENHLKEEKYSLL
jgi:RNA polymerase sigma factor (sigma-70 family)